MAKTDNSLKTFSQFIIEGRDAPLYHSTGFMVGFEILRTGLLEPRTRHLAHRLLKRPFKYNDYSNTTIEHKIMYSGISLTGSFKYADEWATGIIFEFDQAKLAQRYEIIPLDYFASYTENKRTEQEEFILFTKPIPINRYLRKFYVNHNKFNTIEKVREHYSDENSEWFDLVNKTIFQNPLYGGAR